MNDQADFAMGSPPGPFLLSRRHVIALGAAMAFGGEAVARGDGDTLALPAYLDAVTPTALMVMREGRIVTSHGETARKVAAASVRKSLIGALYGIAVEDGKIALGDTLDTLGIDDLAPTLSASEKRATVADLIKARSGVYHVAAYETRDMRERRPARGSHLPGTFWFYNNWDFNVLGTIYRQRTGEDVFESFARRIARPIGMQDFVARDGRYVGDPRTRHEAYVFRLTARDMLRFGEMMLAQGRWQGRQIVPAQWLADSLTAYSTSNRGDLGYGYLWWVLDPAIFGPGAGFAAGFGGQFIAVVPRYKLVLAQTAERRPAPPSGVTRRLVRLLKGLVADA